MHVNVIASASGQWLKLVALVKCQALRIGGGTGVAPGHRAPIECEISTLTLWALHGKNQAKYR